MTFVVNLCPLLLSERILTGMVQILWSVQPPGRPQAGVVSNTASGHLVIEGSPRHLKSRGAAQATPIEGLEGGTFSRLSSWVGE